MAVSSLFFQLLARPRWLAAFLRDGGLMSFPNVVVDGQPMPYADVGAALEQSMVSWDDFRWIREVRVALARKLDRKATHSANENLHESDRKRADVSHFGMNVPQKTASRVAHPS